jgi:CRP-like cAMP-binding protein
MCECIIDSENVKEALSHTFLCTLSPLQKTKLFKGAELINVEAGSIIFREHDVARICIVVSGLVRAYRMYPNGRQTTMLYNHPGDIIGVMRFSRTMWHMDAEAVTDGTLLLLPTESFIDFFDNDSKACWALYQLSCQRWGMVLNELPYYSQGPARRRIARYLLEIASLNKEDQSLSATATHQVIAEAVSLTRESVTRTLNEFRKSSLVELSRRHVVLLDPQGLHLIASSEDDAPPSS